jgi:hypothetical protein
VKGSCWFSINIFESFSLFNLDSTPKSKMSLTKAQQKAYQKMREQKNKAPTGATAEGKAKSKADASAYVCQVILPQALQCDTSLALEAQVGCPV